MDLRHKLLLARVQKIRLTLKTKWSRQIEKGGLMVISCSASEKHWPKSLKVGEEDH
jgi:hypothetical protein